MGIENVVVIAAINQSLDLDEIKIKFPKIRYNPKEFPRAVFKIEQPKTTTLIFSNGNMVCTGGKPERHANIAINKVVEQLRSKDIKIKNNPNILIQNVVTVVNLGGENSD